MPTKLEIFIKSQLKTNLPEIRPGDTVRINQKIKDYYPPTTSSHAKGAGPSADKERIQTFEGIVIARKHGKGINSTITLRKVISGIGVERIFPLHSPLIEKIEIIRKGRVRRAKLYYLRGIKGKKARLKSERFVETLAKATENKKIEGSQKE